MGTQMTPPSLRLVEALPDPLTYVVSRTEFIQPGTACVIAALADVTLAGDDRYSEAEVYTAGEMRRQPTLAEALRRWERGDHDLYRRERESHERIEAAYRASIVRAARRHPSMLTRA